MLVIDSCGGSVAQRMHAAGRTSAEHHTDSKHFAGSGTAGLHGKGRCNYPAYEAHLAGAAAVVAVQDGGYAEVSDDALNALFLCPKSLKGGTAMPRKAPEKIGSVLRVPLSQLHPHPQNPFAVRDDSAMQELKESVSQNGVLVPAIARPRAEGGYELIAGHRRKYACELAGQDSMPVIVLNLNDDEAVIQLVDSNIQREDILPSERARAYKMKMDAIKRQGSRTDLTSPNGSAKFRSDDLIGETAPSSFQSGCLLRSADRRNAGAAMV